MRSTQKPFRLALFNALDGNVSYDSQTIGFYDEKKKAGDQANIYITFGRQSERIIEQNDSTFITQSTITLAVTHKVYSETSKDVINDITDSILLLLMPTPQTNGFTDPSNTQVQNIMLLESETGIQITQTGISLTQTITLTAQIVQQL